MFKPVTPAVDFPKIERELLEKWYKNGIVKKYLEKNKDSSKTFSFLDGPITANNPMGVHHAWGRTYKDLWQRFWNMRGSKQRFQNGFDEQGLWVEVEVEKELGLKNKKDIENLVAGNKFKSLEKFINLCKERVKKYSTVQTEQSKRLGYFMDWDNSYHTSSDENNYAIWSFIKTVHTKGWLYKGRDSVPWCPRCGTAISQHEILTEEYKEISHDTVFFKLPITNKGWENTYFLVWTTTPWTIPANVAVGFNSKYDYGVWKDRDSGEKYVFLLLGEERKPATREAGKLSLESWVMNKTHKNLENVGTVTTRELLSLRYRGPFDELELVEQARKENPDTFHSVIDASDVVSDEEGTGLLHVAPGAGEEDFKLSQKHNLSVIAPIEEDASYVDGMGDFSTQNAKKNPHLIINYLKKPENKKFLFKVEKIKHRYPTCWRCKTELVWRVVDEWYIAMDKKDTSGKTYREQMINVAKKINWIPKWGLDRELDWLRNMHDWLISKKRYWGLALPIWECKKCGNFEVISGEDELKKMAVEGFDRFRGNSPHRPWIDEIKIKCSKCSKIISRIPDVGNPWLDAGIVPFSTMPKEWFPADFITESFPGQFKNWFYSLIAMSTALKNTNPFKTVLGFASVRDEKGEEMHKSKGNAIEFNEAADKIGVDMMRWLYVRTNPEYNVNFGYNVADEIRRLFHLRLWNVYVFFVTYASVDKWKPSKAEWKPKHVLDRWILSRMHGNIKNITLGNEKDPENDKGLINYNAYDAAGNAEIFIIRDLSTWYVRRIRDRVGVDVQHEEDKNDAYQTLWLVLTTYARVLAPFMPFITDEIYTNLTDEESVHLTNWPQWDDDLMDDDLEKDMENGIKLSSKVHALRKEKRVKVRIPLRKLSYKGPVELTKEVEKIVLDEVNVYELTYAGKSEDYEVSGDTSEKNQDIEAGIARDIIRQIQEERKILGTKLDEKVTVVLPNWPKAFTDEIKKKALVGSLAKGEQFKVLRDE